MKQPAPADDFLERLQAYKKAIDADIEAYSLHVRSSTSAQYGTHAAAVTDTFLDVLSRGGKRVRGALVIAGYEMCGGRDRAMIVRAATALEMIHAYILMVDDIQDRSDVRRGKPTAHRMLEDYHREQGFRGDAAHTGMSLALMAALSGMHAAQTLLAGLSVEADIRVKALGIVNQAIVVTAHGQTQDIINELAHEVSVADIDHVLEWKTAYYTFLNPLCTGMVLAGAGCEDTDAIRAYALAAGRAFQIGDDIIGVFGDDEKTGKRAMDDIREGKRTILTTYALAHAPADDAAFLGRHLGDTQLDVAAFERCRDIIESSGARSYAEHALQTATADAQNALQAAPARWQAQHVGFLRDLARYLADRTA